MNEVLSQLLVPGGVVTILALWWTTSHTKPNAPKTSVDAQRETEKTEEQKAVALAWTELLEEVRKDKEEAESENTELKFREGIHFSYHWDLRNQIIRLKEVPLDWPIEIDPRRRH